MPWLRASPGALTCVLRLPGDLGPQSPLVYIREDMTPPKVVVRIERRNVTKGQCGAGHGLVHNELIAPSFLSVWTLHRMTLALLLGLEPSS